MAEKEGESSNQILETLEEWNDYLNRYTPYFKDTSTPIEPLAINPPKPPS